MGGSEEGSDIVVLGFFGWWEFGFGCGRWGGDSVGNGGVLRV